MEIEFQNGSLVFTRELSSLDRMAIYFSEKLTQAGIEHTFVSGYVAILFGRNRSSEDIDVICRPVSEETFMSFWNSLGEMECIITDSMDDAYMNYLEAGLAVRFSYRGEIIPNIEMKFASNSIHREVLEKRITVVVNGKLVPISPFELQIAYKLFLGSQKDIEDARFLFDLFSGELDLELLEQYMRSLNLNEKEAKKYIGWSE